MQIYKPVPGRMTQKYGESRACALTIPGTNDLAFPYKTILKPSGGCPTGYTSLYEALGGLGHMGEDFFATKRESVYFDIYAEDENGNEVEWEVMKLNSTSAGHGILIRSLSPIQLDQAPAQPGAKFNMTQKQYIENGGAVHLMRYFGHLDEPSHLKDRSVIKFGDRIGYAGTTGISTGVHVHRHLFVCNGNDNGPFLYIDGDSDMKGRIDESEWFVDDFAVTIRQLLDKRKTLMLQVIDLAKQLIAVLLKRQK